MKNIKLIVLDVDGTLTDGRLIVDNNDNHIKNFSAKDGIAMHLWIKQGGKIAILTGKTSNVVLNRANELGVNYIIQGSRNKSKDLIELIEKEKISLEETAYMGDDINDLGAIKKVKFSGAPNDACPEILSVVDFISTKNGGFGAVREFLEFIMKGNGMWDKIIEEFKNQ